ncbi:hypothetical protein [Reichenbachiella sp. 5M10]|uniref:hypothetical protein n=1 Tax=Reichenbachiella sp. 5M10 TaxID=1889772 RepID=UPI00117AB4CF|nr:hypothetical protein [Reichenbachiella sp. 5M10]
MALRSVGLGLGVINDNGLIDGDDYGNTLGFEFWLNVELSTKAKRTVQVRYNTVSSLFTRQELGTTQITNKGTKRFYDGTPNANETWYRLTYEVETDLWDKYKDHAIDGRTYVTLNNQTPLSVYRHEISTLIPFAQRMFVDVGVGSVRLDHGRTQLLTSIQSKYHYLLEKHGFNNEDFVRTIPGLETNATYAFLRTAVGINFSKSLCEGAFTFQVSPEAYVQKNITLRGGAANYSSWQWGASVEGLFGLFRYKTRGTKNIIEINTMLSYDPYEAFPKYYDLGAMGSYGLDLKLNFLSKKVSAKGRKKKVQLNCFLIPFGIMVPFGEGEMNSLAPYQEAKKQSSKPEFTNKVFYAGVTIVPLH